MAFGCTVAAPPIPLCHDGKAIVVASWLVVLSSGTGRDVIARSGQRLGRWHWLCRRLQLSGPDCVAALRPPCFFPVSWDWYHMVSRRYHSRSWRLYPFLFAHHPGARVSVNSTLMKTHDLPVSGHYHSVVQFGNPLVTSRVGVPRYFGLTASLRRLCVCHPSEHRRISAMYSALLGSFISLIASPITRSTFRTYYFNWHRARSHSSYVSIISRNICPQLHGHSHSLCAICLPCPEIWPSGCLSGTMSTYVLFADKTLLGNSDLRPHINGTSSTTSHRSSAESLLLDFSSKLALIVQWLPAYPRTHLRHVGIYNHDILLSPGSLYPSQIAVRHLWV